MKRFLHLFVLVAMACFALAVHAEDYTMPTDDGFIEEKVVDGTITFYDMGGPSSNTKSFFAGYVRFVPANEGDLLTITFEELDLGGVAKLYIYDGDAGWTSYYDTEVKAGYLAELSGNTAGQSYSATSGQLSVLYHCKGSGLGSGWKATVTSVPAKDMEYVSTSVMTGLGSVSRGSKNQTIYGVSIVTDGGSNALTLDELSIDCSALAGSDQVSNVRLYKGSVSDDNLLATAAATGDELKATNITLKPKSNDYIVVADVLPDASGTIPTLAIGTVKVSGEVRTPDVAQGDGVVVDNVILMPSAATVYTIGDDAEFYDDGGKSGKIALNFVGQATFVPATDGSKVKIDFTKLAIFNTSTVGKNDVLKIYNGREADEANLLCTLLSESSKIVKSTADDGSLTVTLTSITGVPAEGWEATVSQFVPGDMTLKSVSATVASDATVSAGETNAQFVTVNVTADNQLNPLDVSAIDIAVTSGATAMKSIKVYYLGETPTFSTAKLFGESAVEGERVSITGEQLLAEGNNYFAVAVDVAEEATNGQMLGLSFGDVTIAGVKNAPATEVSAIRNVENVCRAVAGTHAHTIYDAWTFTDTKSTITPSKYEYEMADYIVTFTPGDSNAKAVIDFSDFDVYYSSSSYGVKAVFEVYSGNAVDSNNLLWKLSSADEAAKGPGKKLYSTAADGSLTIKFNPNTEASYYAATGWKATVSPFVNHDMTITDIKVTQEGTGNVTPGSKSVALLCVDVATEGTLTTKKLSGVTINLKGTHASVDKIAVMSSADNRNFANADTEFGSISEPGEGDLQVNGSLALSGEHHYLWVVADVSADAESDAVIDAKLVSITTADGETISVAEGDPQGECTVKNQMILANGDNGVVTVTRSLLLYDDGGPDGKFSKGFDGTVTFVPGKEDAIVSITTKQFATGTGKFYLYSGREVNADNLLGTSTYFSGTTGPVDLVSKAADGSITVRFVTSSYATLTDGFEVEIALHQRENYEVAAVASAAASGKSTIVRGSTDAELLRVKMDVTGDKNALSVDAFKFTFDGTTAASDIAVAKLYYTASAQNFGNGKLLASSVPADGEVVLVPAEDMTIESDGEYNFWLAVDVAADAQKDNAITARLASLTIGGEDVAAEKIDAVAATRSVTEGLSGEYTIGSSGEADYATIGDAVDALADGIEGAVTFLIEDGTYAENVMINHVDGVSAEHTIKFASQSGDRTKVVITGSGYSEPAYGETKYGMFAVVHTPYVILENLSFEPQSQSYPYAVHVYNQSRHFTLRNCVVKADPVVTGSSGMSLVKAEALNEEACNNDFMTIENCVLEGGYIALYLGGTSYLGYTREQGLVVRGNTVTDAGSKGIYVTDEEDALIESNVVTSTATQKANYSSIDLSRCRGELIVRNNVLVNTQNYYSNGLYIRNTTQGDEARPALIYNNAISVTSSPNAYSSALYLAADSRNIKVLYNTVRVGGDAGYAFYVAGTTLDLANTTVENNILQSFAIGSAALYLYGEDRMKALGLSNNAYYAAGGVLVKDLATTLADYTAIIGDEASISEKAEFVSETDLRLLLPGNMLGATPLSEVTVDINGINRSESTPTRGAYEYVEIADETPQMAEGYPVVSSVSDVALTVKTRWNVSGKLYAMVQTADADAPDAATVLAQQGVDCIADTEVSTSFNELTQQTAYKVYFVAVSALGAQSGVVATDVITTQRTIAELQLDLSSIYDLVNAGDAVSIEPAVSGGDEPYTYEWLNQMNEVVGTESKLAVNPTVTSQYRLKVTSADGQSVEAKTAVYVLGDMANATFDDNYLTENSWWNGDVDGGDTFYSGSFAFSNYKVASWAYWESFAYANCTGNTYSVLNDQYNNATGGGADNTGAYAVAYAGYYSTPTIEVTNSIEGVTIPGVYVNNTAWAVKSMSEGDSYTNAFAAGDYMKVIFTGYDAEDNATGTVDCYLADYTSADEANHYMLTQWQWVDLSSLGNVVKLTVGIAASQSGVPTYVCLDQLGASAPSGIHKVVDADGEIAVYPVPTTDVLHVSGIGEKSSVNIYSINGQLVGTYVVGEREPIDVCALASGMYVIEVTTPQGVVRKQFVKM
ncbi:MAG: DUF4465 domain-containing protein [Muribaculaceae bacterium]